MRAMKKGLSQYGFSSDDFRKEENVDYETISDMLKSTAHRVRINEERGLKTLVIVNFKGHGVIDKGLTTQAVLNDPEKPLYPIEQMLRNISKLRGCFVIGLLDCSRVDWDPEETDSN